MAGVRDRAEGGPVTPRAVVLLYHRLSDRPFDPEEGDYVLPPSLFEAQVRELAAGRHPVVPLASLADGRYDEGAVVLTFDDGCDSDATVAAPLLRLPASPPPSSTCPVSTRPRLLAIPVTAADVSMAGHSTTRFDGSRL
jgi:hypothetical protein